MERSGIDVLGLERVMKRGSGEILSETDHALLIRDTVSGAYMLACEDRAEGRALLEQYVGSDCSLLMVTDTDLGRTAFERFGFREKLECCQVAFYGERPCTDTELSVRTADESDLPVLLKTYDRISPEELSRVVRRGKILLGYEKDQLVGFIGEHLEGSMGLLYVFPEYRQRGFASALEKKYIAKTMDEGFVPFGQVETGNVKSLKLQKKIGMTVSDQVIVWMWK